MTRIGRQGIIERIDELLEARYRSADLGNIDDALAETIYILVSQQTREAVYRRVFAELRAAYPTWRTLLYAPPQGLQRILRPAGFHQRRAVQLQDLLRRVDAENRRLRIGPYAKRRRDLTLDFLQSLSDADAEAFLTSLPGIGLKTARCVLAYSLNRKKFPVDTHVHRVFTRMALTESRGRKSDHDPFQEIVPPAIRKRLHMNLVHHGRAVCRTSNELCGSCVLISFCARGRATEAKRSDTRPTAIDLFAGAGGLGRGFRSEDFRIAAAVESDRNAAQTYRLNNPGVPVFESRIGPRSAASTIRRASPALGKIDVVLAGPPCQGYSAAGPREKNDPRNSLYRHVVRIARGFRAKFVVIENVPGVRRVGGAEYAASIERALATAGYTALRYDLRASEFGIPQRRRRFFFIGRFGKKQGPAQPEATHAPPGSRSKHAPLPVTPSLSRLLLSIPVLKAGRAAERIARSGRTFLNMSTMRHSAGVVRKISKIKQGEGPISYRRLESTEARTLIAGHRALPVHPTLDRTISVREAALIQGFPNDYFFCGPRAEQPLQVANAVPPPLAAAVARRLRPYMRTSSA